MTAPACSVIIPTRNRPQAVVRCLDALATQTLLPGTFEVLVVDDGSDPPLALDPSRWATAFALTVIRQPHTGPAGARNRGVAEARGACVAFTDDDCSPTPGWLAELLTVLQSHPDALVGGSTINGLPDDHFAATNQLILEMVYEHFNREPANAYFLASNNVAMQRSAFLAVGGFDADFQSPGAEDREFCDRWRVHGWPLVMVDAARLEHRHAQSLAGFCRMYWRYGQGAFVYQAKRKARESGTMADDLRFHRAWPRLLPRKLRQYPWPTRGAILTNLLLWQLANAAGFISGFLRLRVGG